LYPASVSLLHPVCLHDPWFLSFFFSSRRRHTRFSRDWSSDVCSSDLHRGHRGCRCADDEQRIGILDALDGRIEDVARPSQRRIRSEERRVGKECRSRWAAYQAKRKENREKSVRRSEEHSYLARRCMVY